MRASIARLPRSGRLYFRCIVVVNIMILGCGIFFYFLFSAMRWDQLRYLPKLSSLNEYDIRILDNGAVIVDHPTCKVLLSLLSTTKRNNRFRFAFYITSKGKREILTDSVIFKLNTVPNIPIQIMHSLPDQKVIEQRRIVTFGRIFYVDIPEKDREKPVRVTLSFTLKQGHGKSDIKHNISLILYPKIVTWWIPLVYNNKFSSQVVMHS